MTNLEGLVIAYQQQFEAVRTCEANEPPYEDGQAHRVWEDALRDLRENLGKSHLALDVALFGDGIPDAIPA